MYLQKLRDWKKAQRKWQPLITVEINRTAIINNLAQIRKLTPRWQIAPVLKANAYGHGLSVVADILKTDKQIPLICVDSYIEAEIIRRQGIKTPLLVIGYTPEHTIIHNTLRDTAFTVGSLELLVALSKRHYPGKIHLKFDTGMHRQGIGLPDVSAALKYGKKLSVEGVFSHLSDADNPVSKTVSRQIQKWNALVTEIKRIMPQVRYFHLSNSAGLALYHKIEANLARTGIALYGINPGNLPINLKPALRIKTVISEVRQLQKRDSVGYNDTFTARKMMRIATVPVGYYEGVDRRLSNKGSFSVAGEIAPIIGRVSMDISSCDITSISDVEPGSEITIISDEAGQPNSVEEIAHICNAIPYEILVHIPVHLRRVIVNE